MTFDLQVTQKELTALAGLLPPLPGAVLKSLKASDASIRATLGTPVGDVEVKGTLAVIPGG